ncbi:MAG: cupin domain-containing protein [Acidobacteriota bacterium]
MRRDGSTDKKLGLRTLFGMPKRDFLRQHWPEVSHVGHGAVDRLGLLATLPAMRDLGVLLGRLRKPVTIFGDKGFQTEVPAATARDLYERGDTLYITNVENAVPELRSPRAELAADLGVHPDHVSIEAFASKRSLGVPMHYDFDVNFNVQLRGTKTWRLAPNHHVVNPTESYHAKATDDHGPPHARRPLPRRMPRNSETVELREGSVMFLPRGVWHETGVAGESFALNFTVQPPTWKNVVLEELDRRLGNLAEWRAYPLGLAGDERSRARLARELATLLPDLARVVDGLDAESLLQSASVSGERFHWPADASKSLRDEGVRGSNWKLRVRRPNAGAEIEVDTELLPLVQWLVDRPSAFTAQDARAACSSVAPDLVELTLAYLLKEGALQRDAGQQVH